MLFNYFAPILFPGKISNRMDLSNSASQESIGYATTLFMLNISIYVNVQIKFRSRFLPPPKVLVLALMKSKMPVNRAVAMHLVAT